MTSRQAVVLTAVNHFNSHAHVERDNATNAGENWTLHFNSHAHVERDFERAIILAKYYNFNSHAHVERDLAELAGAEYEEISTHTLTWSVTLTSLLHLSHTKFQLTRSRGA